MREYHTKLFKLSLDLVCIRCWLDFEVSIEIAICFGLHAVKQSPPINGEFQARLNSTNPQHNHSCYEEAKEGTDLESKMCFREGSKVVLIKCKPGVCAGAWSKPEALKYDASRKPWRSGTCVRSRSYSSEAVRYNG